MGRRKVGQVIVDALDKSERNPILENKGYPSPAILGKPKPILGRRRKRVAEA
jgi:hypothetical protein